MGNGGFGNIDFILDFTLFGVGTYDIAYLCRCLHRGPFSELRLAFSLSDIVFIYFVFYSNLKQSAGLVVTVPVY